MNTGKTKDKVCPICKGNGTVPTECPRCFGSGKEEPEHTLFALRFRDNVAMLVLDDPRNPGFRVRPYETIRFDNIYIGKHVTREFKCTSAWYISRWGRGNDGEKHKVLHEKSNTGISRGRQGRYNY